jgi:hypothetical protein
MKSRDAPQAFTGNCLQERALTVLVAPAGSQIVGNRPEVKTVMARH